MQRILAMFLLLGGAMLASVYGAQNGDHLVEYRQATANVAMAQELVDRQERVRTMQAALQTLRDFDLAVNPEGLPPDRAETLTLALRTFGLELTREDLDRAEPLASDATEQADALFQERELALTQSGFLGEAGVEDLLPRAQALPPTQVRQAVTDMVWTGIVSQAEARALQKEKQELISNGGPQSAEDKELLGIIDMALQTGDAAIVMAELARRGEALQRPTPEQVRDALLGPQHRANTLRALVNAGVISDRQSPQARLLQAQGEQYAIGVPPPRERFAAWLAVGGLPWGVGILCIAAGALLARRQIAVDNAMAPASSGSELPFPATLSALERALDELLPQIEALPMDQDAPAAREQLEHLQATLIDPLVDDRGKLQARHGLAAFAEYFSPFSAAERNLARAWSALTDGHSGVAYESLLSAQANLREARAAWAAVEA